MACGSEELTTGAWLELTIDLPFTGGTGSHTVPVKPHDNAEFALTKGLVTCGALDTGDSYVALTGFDDAAEDEAFKLKATLVDGSNQTVLFEWESTLRPGSKQVPLSAVEAALNPEAKGIMAEILKRDDPTVSIRYDYEAPVAPAHADIRVVLVFRVATADGTCPSTD